MSCNVDAKGLPQKHRTARDLESYRCLQREAVLERNNCAINRLKHLRNLEIVNIVLSLERRVISYGASLFSVGYLQIRLSPTYFPSSPTADLRKMRHRRLAKRKRVSIHDLQYLRHPASFGSFTCALCFFHSHHCTFRIL